MTGLVLVLCTGVAAAGPASAWRRQLVAYIMHVGHQLHGGYILVGDSTTTTGGRRCCRAGVPCAGSPAALAVPAPAAGMAGGATAVVVTGAGGPGLGLRAAVSVGRRPGAVERERPDHVRCAVAITTTAAAAGIAGATLRVADDGVGGQRPDVSVVIVVAVAHHACCATRLWQDRAGVASAMQRLHTPLSRSPLRCHGFTMHAPPGVSSTSSGAGVRGGATKSLSVRAQSSRLAAAPHARCGNICICILRNAHFTALPVSPSPGPPTPTLLALT